MQGFFIAPAMGVLTSELLAIGPPVDNTELQKNETSGRFESIAVPSSFRKQRRSD
jgi:hypothetical protein